MNDVNDKTLLEGGAPRLMTIGAAVAVIGLGASIALGLAANDGGKQFFQSYLHGLVYFLSISLGALFFVALQHITRAGWSVAVRRIAEIMATTAPVLAFFLLPIVISMLQGNSVAYPWINQELVQADHVLHGKSGYLNAPFFAVRWAIYVLVWGFVSTYYYKRSLQQDATGDIAISYQLQWASAPAIAAFALSVSFFAFDFIMSLDPFFFSTVFGVYFFAGCMMSFFCTMILISKALQNAGYLTTSISTEHFHDLGKFTFGFVFFWGYIGFSQYMLIWYGNLPEETVWFQRRQTGDWVWVSLALLFGHFLIPFPGLLSRHVKRNGKALVFWAIFLLGMHWIDLYWLIAPVKGAGAPGVALLDLTCWLGFAGIFMANFGFRAKGNSLMPKQDPRLNESLAFENM